MTTLAKTVSNYAVSQRIHCFLTKNLCLTPNLAFIVVVPTRNMAAFAVELLLIGCLLVFAYLINS